VNHLLFADDTLIFCGAQEQIPHLRCIFLGFEAASGLRINLGKSEIVLIGGVEDVERLANLLGCRVASLPMTYLGLPLGASYKSTSIWNDVIEKMERRLAGWKRMYLSKGARLTLINSTLSNIPTYYLSLFPIPMRVANRLDKIQNDFLWGGIGNETKFHLVNWNKICTPLHAGGLGVHNFIRFNQALLGEWLWRYGRERDALWRLVIDAKFESLKGGWCSKEVSGSFGVGVWKHIRRGWEKFRNFVRFEVGNGSNISFWQDWWCGDRSLKQCFPDLFSIVRNKDAMVADNLVVHNGVIQWNVLFTRQIQDWEMDMVFSFFDRLYSTSARHGEGDRLVWDPSKKCVFEVRSFYEELIRKDGPCVPYFP
jgi:hypothetical protein